MLPELRKPTIVDPPWYVAEKDDKFIARQKRNFDKCHDTRELSPLLPGDTVWITDRQSSAIVTEESAPRSYAVDADDGTFRRNMQKTSLNPSTRQGDSDIPDQSITDSLNTPIVNLILILMIKN